MMLLVDIGNSRVKWACAQDGRLSPQQAAEHAAWQAADWRALLAQPDVRSVVAASVAGGDPIERLRTAALEAGCAFERVTTSAVAAGVRNAYPDPQLLGVDRWLAIVAAHHLAQAPCCVVDVGTAMTVDAVTGDGQHLGGFILPGPRLMIASLHHGTSDLAAHSRSSNSDDSARFATNTRDAIERGAVVALAALADRAIDELAQLAARTPVLLLTGGAAPLVAPFLRTRPRAEPDLVLQGLVLLAAAGG